MNANFDQPQCKRDVPYHDVEGGTMEVFLVPVRFK